MLWAMITYPVTFLRRTPHRFCYNLEQKWKIFSFKVHNFASGIASLFLQLGSLHRLPVVLQVMARGISGFQWKLASVLSLTRGSLLCRLSCKRRDEEDQEIHKVLPC